MTRFIIKTLSLNQTLQGKTINIHIQVDWSMTWILVKLEKHAYGSYRMNGPAPIAKRSDVCVSKHCLNLLNIVSAIKHEQLRSICECLTLLIYAV